MTRHCLRILMIVFCGLLLVPHPVPSARAASKADAGGIGPARTHGIAGTPHAKKERRELWTGSLYSSTYRAGVCIKRDGEVYGALYLRQAGGAVDRYTITGTVEGDRITARHHSGHEFKGRFVSEDRVQGELTLKTGHTIEVRAVRGPEPEVDEFCRLVQQE